jgi:ribonuclease E
VAVTAPQILKNDSIESFTVESIAPVDTVAEVVPASIAVAIVEAEATTEVEPAPVVAAPAPVAPTPAPARPPVGNTGSLFFTVDADTPPSVTRHLFEPVPPVAPAVDEDEAGELPLLAAHEEKTQDNDRNA